MKKRKKYRPSSAGKRSGDGQESIRGWFLAWIPVGYMILGVYGWIGTALGIFDPACEREVLDMAVLLLGIWFGILYMQKNGRYCFS